MNTIARKYVMFLKSLARPYKTDSSKVTAKIWEDMWEIREALNDYSEVMKKSKNWSVADIFQDLIARYLYSVEKIICD